MTPSTNSPRAVARSLAPCSRRWQAPQPQRLLGQLSVLAVALLACPADGATLGVPPPPPAKASPAKGDTSVAVHADAAQSTFTQQQPQQQQQRARGSEGVMVRREQPRGATPAGNPASLLEASSSMETIYKSLVELGTVTDGVANANRAKPVTPVLDTACMPANSVSDPASFLRSDAYQHQVRDGQKTASERRIIFAGLWRQIGANGVRMLYNAMKTLGTFFRDYQIIMLENDSTDDTVRGIEDVCGNDEHGSCFTLSGFGQKVLHYWVPDRVKGLTALRQLLLKKVLEFDAPSIYDYVMMVDGDIYAEGNAGFDIAGSLAAFSLTMPKNGGADSLCAFQLSGTGDRYRDTFAHRGPECTYKDFATAQTCKADSCGGGLVMYSIRSIREGNCDYKYVDEKTCEHIPFNQCLAAHKHDRLLLVKSWAVAMNDFNQVSTWTCEKLRF